MQLTLHQQSYILAKIQNDLDQLNPETDHNQVAFLKRLHVQFASHQDSPTFAFDEKNAVIGALVCMRDKQYYGLLGIQEYYTKLILKIERALEVK